MADDPTTDPQPDPEPETPPAQPATSDDVEAMRAALRKANREAADSRAKLKALEDVGKSELDKLRDDNQRLARELGDALGRADRFEVAIAKGLNASQAKRLVGATRDELEADADEIIEAFPATSGSPPPSRRPAPNLRGGTEPNEEPDEMDPAKLAAGLPRL
jgi:hypothetical protein